MRKPYRLALPAVAALALAGLSTPADAATRVVLDQGHVDVFDDLVRSDVGSAQGILYRWEHSDRVGRNGDDRVLGGHRRGFPPA